MNPFALLDAYEEQIRRHPEGAGGSIVVERDPAIVRVMAADDGWIGVTYSDPHPDTADEVIASQVHGSLSSTSQPSGSGSTTPTTIQPTSLSASAGPD